MEEQNHVLLREQMVSTLLFSYPSATEWTQIMYWKKICIFHPTESLKQYYLLINYHRFCGSQKEYKRHESIGFHMGTKDTGFFFF